MCIVYLSSNSAAKHLVHGAVVPGGLVDGDSSRCLPAAVGFAMKQTEEGRVLPKQEAV